MKTKEKEIQKKIKELCELMGDKDRFILFRRSDNVVNIALPNGDDVSDNHISAALAAVINAHLTGKSKQGIERLSEIIIDAIEAIIGMSPVAGAKLAARFTKAPLLGMVTTFDNPSDDDDDKEDYDDEDCENCEFLKKCDNKAAIKYRKEHGISKPKKGKKGGHKVDVN